MNANEGHAVRPESGVSTNPTQRTLLEQMRITEFEIEARKNLLNFDTACVQALLGRYSLIEKHIDTVVQRFYSIQIAVPEIASVIGDADTLRRLESAQRGYILDLFRGCYGLEYVNNRLRIGLVHRRIGVEPKLYLSALHLLKTLLVNTIREHEEVEEADYVIRALDKLMLFDVTLVFETYIQSLVSEIEAAKNKTEKYAKDLEDTVLKRNGELRTDTITGLTTRRYLNDSLQSALRRASRRAEPLSLVFMDINDFKAINDHEGHARGDVILKEIGKILLDAARGEDICVRYGGDEFCIILANCTEDQAQDIFCKRVNTLMGERLEDVALSMGVVQTGPVEYLTSDALFSLADERMYQQKRDARQAKHLAVSTESKNDS